MLLVALVIFYLKFSFSFPIDFTKYYAGADGDIYFEKLDDQRDWEQAVTSTDTEHSIKQEFHNMKMEIEGLFRHLSSNARCGSSESKFQNPVSETLRSYDAIGMYMSSDQGRYYIDEILSDLTRFESLSYNLSRAMLTDTELNLVKRRKRFRKLRSTYDRNNKLSSFINTPLQLLKRGKPLGNFIASVQDMNVKRLDIDIFKALIYMKMRGEGLKYNIIFQQACVDAASNEQANNIHFRYDKVLVDKLVNPFYEIRMRFVVKGYVHHFLKKFNASKLQSANDNGGIGTNKSYNSKALLSLTNELSQALSRGFQSYSFAVAVWKKTQNNDGVTAVRWSAINMMKGEVRADANGLSAIVVWRDRDIAYNPLHVVRYKQFLKMKKSSMNLPLNSTKAMNVVNRLKRWIDDENVKYRLLTLYFYWILVIRDDVRHSVMTSSNIEVLVYEPSQQTSNVQAMQQMFLSRHRLYIAF